MKIIHKILSIMAIDNNAALMTFEEYNSIVHRSIPELNPESLQREADRIIHKKCPCYEDIYGKCFRSTLGYTACPPLSDVTVSFTKTITIHISESLNGAKSTINYVKIYAVNRNTGAATLMSVGGTDLAKQDGHMQFTVDLKINPRMNYDDYYFRVSAGKTTVPRKMSITDNYVTKGKWSLIGKGTEFNYNYVQTIVQNAWGENVRLVSYADFWLNVGVIHIAVQNEGDGDFSTTYTDNDNKGTFKDFLPVTSYLPTTLLPYDATGSSIISSTAAANEASVASEEPMLMTTRSVDGTADPENLFIEANPVLYLRQ
jgi:hypothetical protein